MAKRGIRSDRPVPSVPDADAEPGVHDEPAIERQADAVPTREFRGDDSASLADLRLRVETLLRRREPPEADAWTSLGPAAITLLLRMIDESAFAGDEAARDRVLATLGQLRVSAAVSRLGQILLDRRERMATRALAANALGRIGDGAAIRDLAQAAKDRDDTIRRQVALAFGRIGTIDAIPHLQALSHDPAGIVVDGAQTALQQCEQQLGVSGIAAKGRHRKTVKATPRAPSSERRR
jgi:HEAT repeat protein